MAIKSTKTIIVHGKTITFNDAYTRIERVDGNKSELTITVCSYTDNTSNELINTEFYKFVPDANENAQRWDKQAYEYIKTLDEYSDAVDC